MLTIQNLKKSCLAKKPACSVVDNASLGLIAPFRLWLPVTGGGWSAAAVSVQSFILCTGLAVS